MRKCRLSLVGKALLCCTFVFNFWNAKAWSDKDQLEYAKLRKDTTNEQIYSKLTEPETRLTTQSGESLYNSFNNCSTIFQKAWENKDKSNFTNLINPNSLKELNGNGALQNGLVLLYSAWKYFRRDQSLTAEYMIKNRIGDLEGIFNFTAVETLASDVAWYLNNEKWKGADWLQKIWEIIVS